MENIYIEEGFGFKIFLSSIFLYGLGCVLNNYTDVKKESVVGLKKLSIFSGVMGYSILLSI